MATKIMISSYKGGVGKTQTSLEMSYAFASKGFRVLGLDYDHQANYTRVLSNNTPTGKRTLPDILIAGDHIQPEDISTRIINARGDRIDFIASGMATGRLEKKLSDDSPGRIALSFSFKSGVTIFEVARPVYSKSLGVKAGQSADFCPRLTFSQQLHGVDFLFRRSGHNKHILGIRC